MPHRHLNTDMIKEAIVMITFGVKLKHLRTKKHLTPKQLGLLLGFTESYADKRIAQYESGNRTPKEDTI